MATIAVKIQCINLRSWKKKRNLNKIQAWTEFEPMTLWDWSTAAGIVARLLWRALWFSHNYHQRKSLLVFYWKSVSFITTTTPPWCDSSFTLNRTTVLDFSCRCSVRSNWSILRPCTKLDSNIQGGWNINLPLHEQLQWCRDYFYQRTNEWGTSSQGNIPFVVSSTCMVIMCNTP